VCYDSVIPDFQWKDGNIAKLEAPEHYIDLEVIAPAPKAADIPLTRQAAARLYNDKGIAFSNGGFLPWRIEDMYAALVNAMKTDRRTWHSSPGYSATTPETPPSRCIRRYTSTAGPTTC